MLSWPAIMEWTDAVLLAEQEPERRLAGLKSLDRLVLTAAHAGLSRLTVIAPRPEQARSLLRPSPTNHAVTIVEPGSPEEAAALAAIASSGRPFLFAHTALALAPRALAHLLAAAQAAGSTATAAILPGPPPAHPLAVPHAQGYCPGLVSLPAQAAPLVAGGLASVSRSLAAILAGEAEASRLAVFQPDPGQVSLPLCAEDRRRAERDLMKSAGKESDGLVARHLNRRVSGALTRLLIRTPLTPNAITAGTLVLGLAAGWALLRGTHGGFVLGTLLYQLNSTLDGCDGEIARLKFLASRRGEWLDSLSDQVGNLSFVLALPVGLYRLHAGDTRYLWLGAFVVAGLLLLLPATFLRTRRVSQAAHMNDFGRSLLRGRAPDSLGTRLLEVLVVVARRDFYALLFLLLALAGWEEVILYLLVLGILGHFPALLLRLQAAPAA